MVDVDNLIDEINNESEEIIIEPSIETEAHEESVEVEEEEQAPEESVEVEEEEEEEEVEEQSPEESVEVEVEEEEEQAPEESVEVEEEEEEQAPEESVEVEEQAPEESESEPEPEPEPEPEENITQKLADINYFIEIVAQWCAKEITRDEFSNKWTERSVEVDPSVDYLSKLDDFEKIAELSLMWNEGYNLFKNNYFKDLSTYELKKPFYNCDDIKTKVKKLNSVIKILVDCANFKYRGEKSYLRKIVNALY